jgi:hypothetical protein
MRLPPQLLTQAQPRTRQRALVLGRDAFHRPRRTAGRGAVHAGICGLRRHDAGAGSAARAEGIPGSAGGAVPGLLLGLRREPIEKLGPAGAHPSPGHLRGASSRDGRPGVGLGADLAHGGHCTVDAARMPSGPTRALRRVMPLLNLLPNLDPK